MTFQRTGGVYPDQSVQSPSGRLQLASITTVLEERIFDIVATVELTLYEGERARWTHADKGSAQQLWVNDDGWAAVLFVDDRLLLFDPDGHVVARADALKLLRADERSRPLLVGSTAGVFWDTDPLGVLVCCDGVTCLSLRTFWGARVVLRADNEPQLPAAWIETLREAELAVARTRLELGSPREAAKAATLLGVERCRAAIPAIQRGSQLLTNHNGSSGIAKVRGTRDGFLYYRYSTLPIACGLALVRLGCAPPQTPGYDFSWHGDYVARERPPDWLAQREQLQPGMSFAELHASLGAPTYLERGHAAIWWYDAPGLSVGVEFSEDVATALHHDREQAWIESFERERRLFF
jgi:hypothetical protein